MFTNTGLGDITVQQAINKCLNPSPNRNLFNYDAFQL